ncbi:MAG TPA: LuxR C-terminal-related transcriptional regulator [Kofleriaceae bacterium]|nr:LuxR C-terminal-related transcriptional regulator [Kofleriaceae bacterium]
MASRTHATLRAGKLTSEGRWLGGVLAGFAAVALLAVLDLVLDLREGTEATHLLAEAAVALVGLGGSGIIARRLFLTLGRARASEAEARVLAERLQASEAEASRWRTEARDLIAGLGTALDRQFERWSLSPAEKEVALLLLKGLSHKQIAEVRSIAEATARQQARAIYRKAGLTGRSDLAAFFLEDLLLPGGTPPPSEPT